ncbi:unnamed protein product, partial [Chrysoparadoxa australica]
CDPSSSHVSDRRRERIGVGGRRTMAEANRRVMRFRPCIDLHQGKVKQIVGSTLTGSAETLETNFESSSSSGDFAQRYKADTLPGGHVIMLGGGCEEAAIEALANYPGGLHIGGGITPTNAQKYLEAGASHIIVTSFVFNDGAIAWDRLNQLVEAVGKERLVLDLSCRRRPGEDGSSAEVSGPYYVVTDKWQKFTDFAVTAESIAKLEGYCDEFLVHGVDVEGKQSGVLEDLVVSLGEWSTIPVTYAGGARTLDDMERVKQLGKGKVDLTIGSALDIFGGDLSYAEVVRWQRQQEAARGTS